MELYDMLLAQKVNGGGGSGGNSIPMCHASITNASGEMAGENAAYFVNDILYTGFDLDDNETLAADFPYQETASDLKAADDKIVYCGVGLNQDYVATITTAENCSIDISGMVIITDPTKPSTLTISVSDWGQMPK